MIPVVIVLGIVLFVVSSRQKHDGAGANPLRTLLVHLILFVLVIAAANALTELLAIVLGDDVFDRTETLASGLATITVTIPVYLGIGRGVLRRLKDETTGERRSLTWNLYLGAVLVVALAWTSGALTAVGVDLIRSTEVSRSALAAIPVWGVVYGLHRWMRRTYGDSEQRRLEGVVGSAIGLGFLWVGAAMTVAWAVDRLILSGGVAIAQSGRDVPTGLVPMLVGAGIWWAYWLRDAVEFPRDALWQVLVILGGSVVALASALVSLGWALFRVVEWFLGDPRDTVAAQFEAMPALLGTGIVGLIVWWYHRTLLTSGDRVTGQIRETATYVMAFLSLVAMVVAVTTLLIAVLVSLFGSNEVSSLSDTDVVLGAIVALVVAVPTWWLYWWPIRQVSDEQARSKVRRGYLVAVFGVGGVVAIGALIALLFEIFQASLDGSFTSATFAGIREPLAVLGAVGLAAWYHWTVWRSERVVADELPPALGAARSVLLVGFSRSTARDLRSVSGRRVVETSLGSAPLVEGDAKAIEALLAEHAGADVIVLANGSGIDVVSAGDQVG